MNQFPRIGGIQIGGAMDFESSVYQAALATQDVMVIGYYPGFAPGGAPINSCIRAIKALNPAARVFLYANTDGQKIPPATPYETYVTAVEAKGWLLKDASGNPVPSFYPGQTQFNNTPNTPPDELGFTSADWFPHFWANAMADVASADGAYVDNCFVAPRVDGDWCCTGNVLKAASPAAAAAIQAGYQRWFFLMRELQKGKLQIGNIGSWTANGAAVPPGYVGMADGGVLEALIGKSYSVESWGGWAKMMIQYRATMPALNPPKLLIFNQHGDPADYQSFRYGFCSCLMDDGYYSFTANAQGYYGVVQFDEYKANLGMPVWMPPTRPWCNGVWRRDFEGGIALVNPKGNGIQAVQLETPYMKLAGTQAISVNDGSPCKTVTMADRDGLILLRKPN